MCACMHLDVRKDMCAVYIDLCVEICMDMRMDMCMEVWTYV